MNKKMFKESLIGMVMGVGIMLSAYYLIPKDIIYKLFPTTNSESVIFFISVIICPFLAIFLHELGHLIAGLIQGFKLQLFVVAFLGIKRQDDKIKFYLNKELQYFGGVAASSPIQITNKLKEQFALILIAGPIFSLVFGLLFITLFIYTNTLFNSSFGIIGIISTGLFFATTIPEKSGNFFTDRKRMQRLYDKGKTGEIEQSYIETTSQLLIDNHYKNLSTEKLCLIQSDTEPIVQFWGYYFEFKHYEELGNSEKAALIKEKLQTYKEIVPVNIWNSLSIN
jgi:hypothetical protein